MCLCRETSGVRKIALLVVGFSCQSCTCAQCQSNGHIREELVVLHSPVPCPACVFLTPEPSAGCTQEFLNKQLAAKEEQRKRDEEESLQFRKQLEADVQLEQEMRHKQKMDARSQKLSRAKDLYEQVALNTQKMRRPLEIKIGKAASL